MPASLLDTNIWIALTFDAHPLYAKALDLFSKHTATEKAYFCSATRLSFLRLITQQKIVAQYHVPTPTNQQALVILDQIIAKPNVGYIEEPPSIWQRFRTFSSLPTSSPNRWMDAYLAAFAVESKLQFVTCDTAFASFGGLNPVVLTSIENTR